MQMSFSDLEFSNTKVTKKQKFLQDMEKLVPFSDWINIISPYYIKNNTKGRPQKDINIMLRMYLLQTWFSLSDEKVEDEIYDSNAMRKFVGIDLLKEHVPDAVTLLRFRHLLEENNLQEKLFADINKKLMENNIMLKEGTIVDATIIKASSSTKNKRKSRDEYMKSTKKNNNWHFGFKSHIGVDKDSGLVHSIETTPANIHDKEMGHKLLHGQEKEVRGDSGYLGIDMNLPKTVKAVINKRLSSIKKIADKNEQKTELIEHKKRCSIRAIVEHSFSIIKSTFGFRKTRYKGGHKNAMLMNILYASVNLYKLRQKGYSQDWYTQNTN